MIRDLGAEAGAELLVVNEDLNHRDILSMRLSRAGYNVTTAASGPEALNVIQQHPVDLILVDYMMPDMTGLDLLRLLRATHSASELPVIMVTEVDDSAKIVEALGMGANDYITKPLNMEVTVARIRAHVDRKQAQDRLRQSEQRYALAALGSRQGIWDWDLDADSIYYSPQWKEILGCRSILSDRPEEWFSRVHAEDRDSVEPLMQALRERGGPPEFMHDFRMIHGEGVTRWVTCHGTAQHDAQGRSVRIAGTITDITQTRAYDLLTGLGNRLFFEDQVGRALSRFLENPERCFGVLFMALDRFKLVNDGFGHLAADKVLVEVARRLTASIRTDSRLELLQEADIVARIEGDTFAVLLSGIGNAAGAAAVASRLQKVVFAPLRVAGRELSLSAQIGGAVARAGHHKVADISRDADLALHEAKSRGRTGLAVFDESMRAASLARLSLENDLQQAVERGEFIAYYQPKVSLQTGALTGFEALARWAHPSKGLLLPAVFIPLAEETGLIVAIGKFMLREASRTLRRWHREFPSEPPLEMSVNVSLRQFRENDLLPEVVSVLAETGIPPYSLHLEITESLLMDAPAQTLRMLEEIKALGVGLKIDDFGTGYSSLNYLHRIPCNELKIDRSFIASMEEDPNSLAIVQTVLELSERLKLYVVAEGVETEQQSERLKNMGCQFAQGYLFAKPLSELDAHGYLAAHYSQAQHLIPLPALDKSILQRIQ